MSKTLSQIATALESDKSAIRQAILSGGGTCPSSHGFGSFASDIGSIPTSPIKEEFNIDTHCQPVLKQGAKSICALEELPKTNLIVRVPNFNTALSVLNGSYFWTFEGNTYYLNGKEQYVVQNNFFEPIYMGISVYGNDIWSDGTDFYYIGNSSTHYKLNKSTFTWESITFNISLDGASYIWSDGTDTYYSYKNNHYIFNKANNTFDLLDVSWSSYITNGSYIWSDGTDTYFSPGSFNTREFVYDKTNRTWNNAPWNGSFLIDGSKVLHMLDGEIFVYSSSYYYHYLKSSHSLGKKVTFSGISSSNFYTSRVYAIGNYLYYSYSSLSSNYQITVTYDYSSSYDQFSFSSVSFYGYSIIGDNSSDLSVNNIWNDRDNIYFNYTSSTITHSLMLDKVNKRWIQKSWNGCSSFSGSRVWSDGTDTYLSISSSENYILDKATSTWNPISSINIEVYANNIWSNGTNIFYSGGGSSNQYEFDKVNKVFNKVTFSGISSSVIGAFAGNHMWSDGSRIYFSYGYDSTESNRYHYVYIGGTSWSSISWNYLNDFDGKSIWTDGNNIYASSWNNNNVVLYRNPNSGSPTRWFPYTLYRSEGVSSNINLAKGYMWSDGEQIYYKNYVFSAFKYAKEYTVNSSFNSPHPNI